MVVAGQLPAEKPSTPTFCIDPFKLSQIATIRQTIMCRISGTADQLIHLMSKHDRPKRKPLEVELEAKLKLSRIQRSDCGSLKKIGQRSR
jgi:hypothetical protein